MDIQKSQKFHSNMNKWGYSHDFPEYKWQHTELYTLENTSQGLHRSTNTTLGLYFPCKTGVRNQFLQTGVIKGSWHIAIISSNFEEFNELFPILSVGTFQASLSLVISFLWMSEENWIFHIHEHNLILQFLGPKCWITWSNAFYFSVGQKIICNLYLHLNLTWLHWGKKFPPYESRTFFFQIPGYYGRHQLDIFFMWSFSHFLLFHSSSSSSELELINSYFAPGFPQAFSYVEVLPSI